MMTQLKSENTNSTISSKTGLTVETEGCLIPMPETDIDLRERSPLSLAFVGDSVIELLVRSRLASTSRASAGRLHSEAVKMVSASAQADALLALEPMLSEEELSVVRRGRNANKATVSKNASVQEYRASTGVEALFGWLYMKNDNTRIAEIFDIIWHHYLEKNNK